MKIIPSPVKTKKLRAVFDDGTHTDFGAKGYTDYIQLSKRSPLTAELHKERYLKRHKSREDWSKYRSAGALSRWVLWNLPTLQESLADYRERSGE